MFSIATSPGLKTPDDPPTTADRVAHCGWCAAAIDPGSEHPAGRLVCARCGSQTTWPAPTDEELERAYSSWYRPDAGRFSGRGDRLLSRLRGRLAHRLDQIAPPGPVLDVGAGDGTLLDALEAVGREAVGLERQSSRGDIRTVELAELDQRFAAIVFWHSLEHLRDAGEAVGRAASLLLEGGVVVIAMPNLDSIQARAFGDRWLALDLPRHLVHVPADALLARIEELGLRPTRVSYLRGGQVVFGWLHGIVATLPTHPHLYDAIRRPAARSESISPARRLITLAAGVLALPLALAGALGEAALRRGGTVYVEARRG